MLDFRVRTFLAVSRLLNYTHAARELNLTQSAVSQHMAFLEKHYGAKLVVFEGKTMRLTREGAALQRAFQSFAHDELLLERRISSMVSQDAVHLNVGTTLTAGEYLVAPPLARYMRKHSDVRVSIVSRCTSELLDLMAKGEIDCAFVEGIFEKSELSWDVLCVQELVCICPSEHPLAGKTCPMDTLLSVPIIVRERESGSRAVLEHALARRNFNLESFSNVMEASSLNIIKAFVAEGLGVSFVYDAAVRSEIEQGVLGRINIEGDPICHDISFIWPKGSLFEENFKAFFDGVAQEFEGIS